MAPPPAFLFLVEHPQRPLLFFRTPRSEFPDALLTPFGNQSRLPVPKPFAERILRSTRINMA